jgi:putative intracellular protease/amidase
MANVTRLSILLFDGFTALDAVGGYEVLARVPGVKTEFVAEKRGVVAADTRSLGLLATRSFAEVTRTDLLYVPGGPGVERVGNDTTFLEKLRELDGSSTYTIGICNGVGLLGAAGLLRGLTATTNFFYRERLAAQGATVVSERYHRAGKYITGAGVSASIDTALFVAKLLAGEAVAKALQLGVEYYPEPPFPERSPLDLPAELRERTRAFQAKRGAELLSAPPDWEPMPA